ncbi:MAG: ferrochelatase, partial [Planctomycetota bacterium]
MTNSLPQRSSGHTLLLRLAGLIWLAVGIMLITRGALMLKRSLGPPENATGMAIGLSIVGGILLGLVKGRFALSVTAKKNKDRILKMTDPKPWLVFGLRTYVLIGGMIGLGVFMRTQAAKGNLGGFQVVGGVYIGIGLALALSSIIYALSDPPPRDRSDVSYTPGPKGVLLANLGTPDDAETSAVRRYLAQFLGDPLVIEVPRPLWKVILYGIILPFRAPTSAKLYRRVWTDEGSPILVISKKQRAALAEKLGPDYHVALGMRYGSPSMSMALKELYRAGCTDIVLAPLFPQYSRTTTASVVQEANRLVALKRAAPTITTMPPYYLDEGYIEAQAIIAREAVAKDPVDHWVFSFHGIPESYETKGDPYGTQCALTAKALAKALDLKDDEWTQVFQSRFGPERWLRPYADEKVPELAA